MIKKHITIILKKGDTGIVAIARGTKLEKDGDIYFLSNGNDFITLVSNKKLKFKSLDGTIRNEFIEYTLVI